MTNILATGTVYLRDIGAGLEYNSGSGWSKPSFPVKFTNTNTGTVLIIEFTTDLTFTGTTQYLSTGSNAIQFGSRTLKNDGTRPIITIDSTADYPGLIMNGTNVDPGYNNISVVNLDVRVSGGSTLATSGGWVAQTYFGNGASNNFIVNCSSSGNISNSGGGIAGAYTGSGPGGFVTIRGCTTSGSITSYGGGIVGEAAGSGGTVILVEQCSTSGAIGSSGGGIYGLYAGQNGCTAIATKCFTSGTIANDGGGIFAGYAGDNGEASASQCYSTGDIGTNAGGIVGRYAGSNSGTVTVSNCYSIGTIDATGGGGIIGANYANTTAYNCYTSGLRAGSTGGIYSGLSTDGASNYSEGNHSNGGSWNATNARTALSTGWLSVSPEFPFIFSSSFRYSPYVLTNILANYAFQTSASATTTTNVASSAGYGTSFLLVNSPPASVSVNSSTGAFTGTAVGTFTLTIVSNTGGDTISSFTLTVTIATPSTPSRTTPLAGIRMSGFDVFNALLTGNPQVIERLPNPNLRFKSYADYLAYRKSLTTIR